MKLNSICISGGAKGADTIFAECAEVAGHDVSNLSFKGHYCKKHQHIIDQKYLNEADPVLIRVNDYLKRTFPSGNLYVDNLLRRNRYQVKEVATVYAVTRLDDHGIPFGGTAWAIITAISEEKMKNVYVYDMSEDKWKKIRGFVINTQTFSPAFDWEYIPDDEVPRPSGVYTGIGSRELTKDGADAIRELYK